MRTYRGDYFLDIDGNLVHKGDTMSEIKTVEDRLRAELDRRFTRSTFSQYDGAPCSRCGVRYYRHNTLGLDHWFVQRMVPVQVTDHPDPDSRYDDPPCGTPQAHENGCCDCDPDYEPTLDEFADSQADYCRELFRDAAQERAEGES